MFVDEGEEILMRGKIGGTDEEGVQRVWEQGTVVTYVITTYDIEYVLRLVKEGGIYPNHGGTDSHTVVSYARYYDKSGNLRKIVPVEWEPVFYDENGKEIEKPDWVEVTYDRSPARAKDYRPGNPDPAFTLAPDFTKNHEDSVCHGSVIVRAQGSIWVNQVYKKVHEAEQIGTLEEPVNLASIEGKTTETYSTANCYMIHAPGYYKIPLVYGNAIKNGSANPQAYQNTNAYAKHGNTSFVTHLGNAISDPYIKNCGATIKDAAIMTTTAEHAVQLVHLDDDFLTIYVERDYIDQSNTVVLIRDTNGSIMWSWHLWITEEDTPHQTLTNSGEAIFFMDKNLGWHTRDMPQNNADRKVMWRPKQDRRKAVYQPVKPYDEKVEFESGTYTTKNIYRIRQLAYIPTAGFGPYYNWGRKDPLMSMPHQSYDTPTKLTRRALYTNRDLTTLSTDKDNVQHTYTLKQGFYFLKQMTMRETATVPWAMLSAFHAQPLLDDGTSASGSTSNAYNVTWWTGNMDKTRDCGPVPLEKQYVNAASWAMWPYMKDANGSGVGTITGNYTRYDDLWCIGQEGATYLANPADGVGSPVKPVKTVYDPCPPGYQIPPNRAFDRLNISTGQFMSDQQEYIYQPLADRIVFPAMPFLSASAGVVAGAQSPYYYNGVYPEREEGVPDLDIYPQSSYVHPYGNSVWGTTMTLWTADVAVLAGAATHLVICSYFNVTGEFISTPLAGTVTYNGITQQMGTDVRSGAWPTWGMSARQVRGIKEMIK